MTSHSSGLQVWAMGSGGE